MHNVSIIHNIVYLVYVQVLHYSIFYVYCIYIIYSTAHHKHVTFIELL